MGDASKRFIVNSFGKQFVNTYFAVGMHHRISEPNDAHVMDVTFLVDEKSQITGLFVLEIYALAMAGLLGCVPGQAVASGNAKQHLSESRTIDTEGSGAAPKIGCVAVGFRQAEKRLVVLPSRPYLGFRVDAVFFSI